MNHNEKEKRKKRKKKKTLIKKKKRSEVIGLHATEVQRGKKDLKKFKKIL